MNLSEHFTLQEMIVSESASRHGLDNTPSSRVIDNLSRLAVTLEEVRLLLGHPLIVTSGYRSHDLNRLIGGSASSAHCHGLAADFIAPPLTPLEACQRIADSTLAFDQLIHEHDWIHLGLDHGRQRREVLTLVQPGNRYVNGIR